MFGLLFFGFFFSYSLAAIELDASTIEPLVLVHGGAGKTPDFLVEPKFVGMKAAVRLGYEFLDTSVVDAVQAAVMVMEDSTAFNAGRGSKLTVFRHVEMDASIMDGSTMHAGSVASVGGIRHPVQLARGVMENTSHVLVVGEGAQRLANKLGVEEVEEEWLITDYARQLLDDWLKEHNITHLDGEQVWEEPKASKAVMWQKGSGTVGAVAIDRWGHVAAATSTGGITGKLPGRVGDSPLLGQGVFADDFSVAVSCTGTGETFMRAGVARRAAYLVEDLGLSAQEASQAALDYMKSRVGGEGGLIAVDKQGDIGIQWNSQQMAWAYAKAGLIHYGLNRGEDFVEEM